jgi:NOL1/NOP2/fmu family ribosome biogenesis protein
MLKGEGHFAAVLRRNAEGSPRDLPLEKGTACPKELSAFTEHISLPAGKLISFGEIFYLAPVELPDLRGLRVLRPGLELGECRKGRFIPAHALALWLKGFPSSICLDEDAPQLQAYLRGETFPGEQKGWTLVKVGPCSIGWAYGAGGILKNHYPKGLRRNF